MDDSNSKQALRLEFVHTSTSGESLDDLSSLARAVTPEPSISARFGERQLRERMFGEQLGPLRLGRFALEGEIGSGGMGRVWLAFDEQLDRRVALKLLRGDRWAAVGDDELIHEAQALARLAHPNVVPVYDVGRDCGQVWMAMEFVPGRTLRAWVAEQRPDLPARLEAWIAAGRGLAAAHEAGLIHRDLKPDNVLMGDDGRVRLIDFGLVRQGLEAEEGGETEGFAGTRAYAAPEQLAGRRVDARADQYAFCVCLWEAACGRTPQVLGSRRGAAEPPPLPTGVRLPSRLRKVLARGLAPEPADRFPSMQALLDTLEPGPRRVWLLPGLLAVLLGAASLGVFVFAASGPVEAEPCLASATAIDELWTAERRETLAAHAGLAEIVDDWSDQWRAAARRSCEEVHVEQVRSPESLDRRRACLETRLAELEAVLDDAAARPDARPLAWLVELEAPRACLAELVLERGGEPSSAREAALALELERALFRLRANTASQALSEREQLAGQLLERARDEGLRRVEALALLTQGRLAVLADDVQGARRNFGLALDLGDALDDLELASRAWAGLSELELELVLDLERSSFAWSRRRELLRRLGDPPAHTGLALVDRGRWHYLAGELEAAERVTDEAIELLASAGAQQGWALASALRNKANVVDERGHGEQALKLYARAAALERGPGGRDHLATPSTPGHTLLNEGMTRVERGDPERGERQLIEALAALSLEVGPRSADVMLTHLALAGLYDSEGRLSAARRHADQAAEISREVLGPATSERLTLSSMLGVIAYREARYAQSVLHFRTAVVVAEHRLSASSPELGDHLTNLGDALVAAGELDEADRVLRRAQSLLEAEYGPDDPALAVTLKARGAASLARGDPAEARPLLERAVALESSKPELAQGLWLLSKAHAEVGEQPLARATAELAAELAAELDAEAGGVIEEIRAWSASQDHDRAKGQTP